MKNNFPKIILVISVIFLLLFCFVFLFLYIKTNDNNLKIQQDAMNIQTETRRRDDIVSLNRALQKISSDRALLENHFIKSSDIVPFLNIIEKAGEGVGALVQIDSVNAKTGDVALMVELRVSGKFETVYKFLTILENSPYVLDFISMDMHKVSLSDVSGKNIKDLNWEAVFKIQLLSFIP